MKLGVATAVCVVATLLIACGGDDMESLRAPRPGFTPGLTPQPFGPTVPPGSGLNGLLTATPTNITAPQVVPTMAYATAVPGLATARVSGMMSYPASGIPPSIIVCAENVTSKAVYCTPDRINDFARFQTGVGYELKLQPGAYHVFSSATTALPPWRAYYSQFVTCGLDSRRCADHTPIVVDLQAGVTLNGIDPGDWYAR
jgi:hypothetical protein